MGHQVITARRSTMGHRDINTESNSDKNAGSLHKGHLVVAFVLFLAVPLLRIHFIPGFGVTQFLIHAVVSVAILVIAVICALRRGSLSVGITLQDVLFAAFFLSYISSALFSRNPALSITEVAGMFSYILMYVLIRAYRSNGDAVRGFDRSAGLCITAAAVALSLWGLAQYFFEIDVPEGLKMLFRTHHYPVVASMGNPNFLSEYLVFSLPIVISCAESSSYKRFLLPAAIVMIAVTVFLTYTRLSWFVLAVVLALVIIIEKGTGRRRLVAISGAVLLVTGVFFLYHLSMGSTRSTRVLHSINGGIDSPFSERAVLYKSGISMLGDAGFFGQGPGMFGYRFLEYQARHIPIKGREEVIKHLVDLDHAHCDFIEVGCNGGYISLVLFIALVAAGAIAGFRNARDLQTTGPLRYAGLIPLLYIPYGLWSFPFYNPYCMMLYCLALACAASGQKALRITRIPTRLAAVLLAVMLMPGIFSARYFISSVYYNRGLRHFAGDMERAIGCFACGIQWYPYNGYNYLGLGSLLLNNGYRFGISCLHESMRYLDNSATYINIARAYREYGDVRLAAEWYEKIIRLRPDIRRARQEYNEMVDTGRQAIHKF
jgi:hypothetical protein